MHAGRTVACSSACGVHVVVLTLLYWRFGVCIDPLLLRVFGWPIFSNLLALKLQTVYLLPQVVNLSELPNGVADGALHSRLVEKLVLLGVLRVNNTTRQKIWIGASSASGQAAPHLEV